MQDLPLSPLYRNANIKEKREDDSGKFIAWADEPFSVVLYNNEHDISFPRVHAEYINECYELEITARNFTYYCTLSNTNKGKYMTNSVHKSIPHW